MRVTQGMEQAQFLTALNQLESSIAHHAERHLDGARRSPRRRKIRSAPGLVTGYNQVLAQSQQYTANGNSATGQPEYRGQRAHAGAEPAAEPARPRARGQQRHRVTADLSAIATQVQQIQGSLLSLANTQDGSGNYIFAGYSTQTQPFALTRPARPTAAIRASGRCRSARDRRWSSATTAISCSTRSRPATARST